MASPLPLLPSLTARSGQDGGEGLDAALAREMSGGQSEILAAILLEHRFGVSRLNIGMTHDLHTLTAILLANHVTIEFPWTGPGADRFGPHTGPGGRPSLSRRLIVRLHLAGIRMALAAAGHHRFLTQIARNPARCWEAHIFFADPEAIPLVSEFTEGIVCVSEATDIDQRAFVEDRLQRLEKPKRLTTRDPWRDGRLA
jgi:hypothetical protein